MHCPECDGPSRELQRRDVVGANAEQARRECRWCGALFSTFEVVAGTVITWQPVDDEGWPANRLASRVAKASLPPSPPAAPPPLRSKHVLGGDASPAVGRRSVSIAQAASIAGVGKRTIYNWLQQSLVERAPSTTGSVRVYHDSLFRAGTGTAPAAEAADPC